MKSLIQSIAIGAAFVSMANAEQISMEGLDALQPANIYILGETHDNPLHHLGQARAINAINPKAVVFEMLAPKQAAVITSELLDDGAALGAALDWAASGWPDFALYYPVFAALGDAKIYGAARPKGEVRRAFKEGAAAVFGAGAERFGLNAAVEGEQLEARMQEQFAAHCEAMPLEMMGGMVEAQRLRDAAFAAVVLDAFEETGGPVVLIAGTGHSHYDWAVPAMLLIANPDESLVSIAFVEAPADPDKHYDFWIETEPVKRDDPCLAFK